MAIAMGVAALGGFYQLVDNVCRRGLVRITHAEINDVFPGRTGLLLQVANDVENVRGEALNALKLVFHALVTLEVPDRAGDR